MDFSVSFWPVVVAAVVYFAIGALWYSPVLFSKPWMDAQGITPETIDRSGMGMSMVVTFVLELVAVVVLAASLQGMGVTGWWSGTLTGLVLGVGIGFVPMAVTAAYENRPRSLLWINGGYHVVCMTVAGFLLGIWG